MPYALLDDKKLLTLDDLKVILQRDCRPMHAVGPMHASFLRQLGFLVFLVLILERSRLELEPSLCYFQF